MSSIRRHASFPVTVLTVAMLFVALLSGRPSAQPIASEFEQIPREFGAAGQPIFAAENCDGAADRVNRMARGLPDQNAQIRRLEAQRDAARQASEAAGTQATDRVRDALLDQVKGKLTDAAKDYVKGTEQFKKAAEFVDDKAAKLGITEADKNLVAKASELAEQRAEVWKSFDAGRQGGRELMQANRNLVDDATSLNKVFVNSGIADKTFDALTDHAMKNPVTAPYAILGKAGRVLIDVAVATGESGIEGRYAVDLDNELNVLRDVRTKMENRITTLTTGCLNPKQKLKAEEERQEGEREVARQEPTQTSPAPSGGGVGKTVKMAAVIGGGLAGGLLLAQSIEDLEELSYPTATTTTTTTTTSPPTSQPSASANYRYGNWNCGASTQCAAVFGNPTGSVGPFCTAAACTAWGVSHGGNPTCTTSPTFTLRGFPPAGRACSDQ